MTADPRATRLPPTGTAGVRSRLNDQLLWMIGIRLVVVTSMLLPVFLMDAAAEDATLTFDLMQRVAGLAYAATILYLVARWLRVLSLYAQAYLQFFGDLALVSYLVAQTGYTISPFSSLYLIVITVATTLLRRRTGVHVATAASLLFVGLTLAAQRGWIGAAHSEPFLYLRLGLHVVAFYAVALLTSYLAGDVARVEARLEETSEDLAALETFHRDVVASVPSGLITCDEAGTITSVNPAGCSILGQREERLIGKTMVETGILSDTDFRLLGATSPGDRRRIEATIKTPTGDRVIGYSAAELLDPDGGVRGYTVIFQDLTPLRRLQEQVRLKDRMAAVGSMAAGLAHEIGNPLAAISGSVQMLARTKGRSAAEEKLLGIVLQESQRLDRTIKDFLAYARPAPPQWAAFDIARLLKEHAELLRNSDEVGPHHTVELDVDEGRVELQGDRDRLQQILWNLSRNALRAMPQGGRLSIEGRRSESSYTIKVVDTGSGMTQEQKERLFQPFKSFFDGGSGIGMAIVYRIVQEHSGHIDVHTGPSGTTIEVRLPLAAEAPHPAVSESAVT